MQFRFTGRAGHLRAGERRVDGTPRRGSRGGGRYARGVDYLTRRRCAAGLAAAWLSRYVRSGGAAPRRRIRIRLRPMAAEIVSGSARQAASQPTRQEAFFFGTPPGDARFVPPAMPVWIDFSDPRGPYGFPDLENRGVKIALDQHGPPIDPDTADRVPSADSLAAAREILGQRMPALARCAAGGSAGLPVREHFKWRFPDRPPSGFQQCVAGWRRLGSRIQARPSGRRVWRRADLHMAMKGMPRFRWQRRRRSVTARFIEAFEELAQNGAPSRRFDLRKSSLMAARDTRPFALLRNSRKTGRLAPLSICGIPLLWRRETTRPFALLRNARKTGRLAPLSICGSPLSMAARDTRPFALLRNSRKTGRLAPLSICGIPLSMAARNHVPLCASEELAQDGAPRAAFDLRKSSLYGGAKPRAPLRFRGTRARRGASRRFRSAEVLSLWRRETTRPFALLRNSRKTGRLAPLSICGSPLSMAARNHGPFALDTIYSCRGKQYQSL